MADTIPETVPEFLREVLLLMTEPYKVQVFRGQSNKEWKPLPTLYRRLIENGYDDSEITEPLVKAYETDIFCESNGLGFYEGNRLSTMIKLQHHGGATRLLDITRDLFVALWFAVEDSKFDSKDGELICYSADPSIVAENGTISTWDQVSSEIPPGEAIVFFPQTTEKRVKAQSAGFLASSIAGTLQEENIFCNGNEKLVKSSCSIKSGLKKDLRQYLQVSRGIHQYSLFPDFSGYAMSHSVSKQFPRSRGKLYDAQDGLVPTYFRFPID